RSGGLASCVVISTNGLGTITSVGLGIPEHHVTAEAESDIFGRHLISIVENDALAQFHFEDAIADAFPRFRNARLQAQIAQNICGDNRFQYGRQNSSTYVALFPQRGERAIDSETGGRNAQNALTVGGFTVAGPSRKHG